MTASPLRLKSRGKPHKPASQLVRATLSRLGIKGNFDLNIVALFKDKDEEDFGSPTFRTCVSVGLIVHAGNKRAECILVAMDQEEGDFYVDLRRLLNGQPPAPAPVAPVESIPQTVDHIPDILEVFDTYWFSIAEAWDSLFRSYKTVSKPEMKAKLRELALAGKLELHESGKDYRLSPR